MYNWIDNSNNIQSNYQSSLKKSTNCTDSSDEGLSPKNINKKQVRNTFYLKIGNSNYPITAYTSREELESLKNRTKPVLTSKTDSWNLGILLFEMLTGYKSPFKSNSLEELCDGISNMEPDLSLIEHELFKILLFQIISLNNYK